MNGVRDGITLDGDAVLADRRRAQCTRNAAADGRVVHGNGVLLNDARSRRARTNDLSRDGSRRRVP